MVTTISDGLDSTALVRLIQLRRWAITLILAYLPTGLFFFFLQAEAVGRLVLCEMLAVLCVTLFHLRLCECPQCGWLFYADSKWGNTNLAMPFAKDCMHCSFSLHGMPSE